MDLLLSEEQSMLRDSAATFAERRGGGARFRARADSGNEIDPDIWREAAEAGWISILAYEDAGGLGLGLAELCLVAEELGRALIAEPVCAAAAVARALGGTDIAASVVAGETVVVPALQEGPRAIGDEIPSVKVSGTDGALTLTGRKTSVPFAGAADRFLVPAMSDAGPVLMLAGAPDARPEATMDGSTSSVLDFAAAPAELLAGPNEAAGVLSVLLDALHLATAAELLGIAEASQDMTVEYLKTRQQFNRPIGSFQALQHRAVDNLAAIEMCRSLIRQAARALDAGGGSPGLASAALSKSSKSALEVCKAAVQMHGGIGFTHEHDIGLYLKRALVLSARYGNSGLHRRRYAVYAEAHDRPAVAPPGPTA